MHHIMYFVFWGVLFLSFMTGSVLLIVKERNDDRMERVIVGVVTIPTFITGAVATAEATGAYAAVASIALTVIVAGVIICRFKIFC